MTALLLAGMLTGSACTDSSPVMGSVAGNGKRGYAGDGHAATAAMLDTPTDVAVDRLGNVYVADPGNGRVRRITADGQITLWAGNGRQGPPAGAVATQVSMTPVGIAVDRDGTLYIADTPHHRVLAVTPEGGLEVVAGTGTPGFSGDKGPAVAALLKRPTDVEVSPSGELYIADAGNFRVRKVSFSGEITSVAGTGQPGYLGEGSAAADADLSPDGLAFGPRGRLYIVESEHNRVRELAPDGTIRSAAGTGEPGRLGDGDSAVEAMLDNPQGVAVDGKGNLYIADFGNHRIRRVSDDGIITTLRMPDPGAAVLGPVGMAIDGRGDLLFTDALAHRVRQVPLGS